MEDASIEDTPEVYQSYWEVDWTPFYSKCPKWKSIWEATHDPNVSWPPGFTLFEVHGSHKRLYQGQKLCIPTALQQKIIYSYHSFLGHVGREKLWLYTLPRIQWPNPEDAKKDIFAILSICETCQACQRPTSKKGPISFTLVPEEPMSSVALDIFHMPKTTYDGKPYDCFSLCVDRHSGWTVAIPALYKGLTGSKVAKDMLRYQWRPFGIPTKITCDQGAHFAGAWWNTMCANLGIQLSFSQAYHHQANGRAEVAGQQIKERMRKLMTQDHVNWVEVLPCVLDRLHDVVGESGFSPYEILFGRQRPIGNLPFTPTSMCEDAQTFFSRMREMDQKVAKNLNDLHLKRSSYQNSKVAEKDSFKIGDKVWYRRPEGSGTKLDTRWIGPAIITALEGASSYVIEIKDGHTMKAHRTFLIPYQDDKFLGRPTPLFYHQRTVPDIEAQVGEWVVEKVLKHRKTPKGFEFLTQWKGFPIDEATWEPPGNFIHRYSSDFVEYLQKNKLSLDLTKYLSATPSPSAVRIVGQYMDVFVSHNQEFPD